MDLNLSPDAYTGSQGNPSFDPSHPFWILVPAANGLSEWITFSQWVDRLAKPLPPAFHLMHMALGVSGEAGELVDALKKHTIYEKPLDIENVKEELGDLLFYMQGIATACGLSWDEVVTHNRDKLAKRYASGSYSNAQAQARADKPQPTPKPQVRIEDWWVTEGVLFGYAIDHPAQPGKHFVRTSLIVRQTDVFVETLNTLYILGLECDPNGAQQC